MGVPCVVPIAIGIRVQLAVEQIKIEDLSSSTWDIEGNKVCNFYRITSLLRVVWLEATLLRVSKQREGAESFRLP